MDTMKRDSERIKQVKKFVKKHKRVIFSCVMVAAGVVIGMHISDNLAVKSSNLKNNGWIGCRNSDLIKNGVDIVMGSNDSGSYPVITLTRKDARDFAKMIRKDAR